MSSSSLYPALITLALALVSCLVALAVFGRRELRIRRACRRQPKGDATEVAIIRLLRLRARWPEAAIGVTLLAAGIALGLAVARAREMLLVAAESADPLRRLQLLEGAMADQHLALSLGTIAMSLLLPLAALALTLHGLGRARARGLIEAREPYEQGNFSKS